MSKHTPTPWRDPGEHALTGYGDINHVLLGSDGKTIAALYANCFNAASMNALVPTVDQAAGNAKLILMAVNNYDVFVSALFEISKDTELCEIRGEYVPTRAAGIAKDALEATGSSLCGGAVEGA